MLLSAFVAHISAPSKATDPANPDIKKLARDQVFLDSLRDFEQRILMQSERDLRAGIVYEANRPVGYLPG